MKGYVWVIVYRIPTTKAYRIVHANWIKLLDIRGADVYGFGTQREARVVLKRLRAEIESFNIIFEKRASVRKVWLGGIVT